MLKIVDVEYLGGYQLELSFNNGDKLVVDLKDSLEGKAYQELKDKSKFTQFGLVRGTIEWYNNADFAPEYLFDLANEQSKIKV